MISKNLFSWLTAVSLMCGCVSCFGNSSNSARSFFSAPTFSDAKISPDGDYLSYLAPAGEDGKRALYTVELASGITCGFKAQKHQEIGNYRWLNNEWLVFNVTVDSIYQLGVYAVRRDDASSLATCELLTASRILETRLPDPNQFWVHQLDSTAYKDSQLVKYDISLISSRKGELLTTFASNGRAVERHTDPAFGYVMSWILTPKGNPGIAKTLRDQDEGYYRIHSDSEWERLPIDTEAWTLHQYADEDHVFATGYGDAKTEGIYLLDLASLEFSGPILSDENYDMGALSLVTHPVEGTWLGTIYEGKTIVNNWTHPQFQAVQSAIDKQFPNRRNVIQSFSDDLDKFVFTSSSSETLPVYYLFDAHAQKIKFLNSCFTGIDESNLSQVFRFEFTTDDQLRLEALFTRPGFLSKTGSKPPLLLLIHGGPWVRDLWTYDPEVQFLASLGYAVLQINYRGSSGFGSIISSDNAFEFEAMMEDLKKGTDLVVKQGWVDPDRIGVMGASFGGYASLFLAAKNPHFFRCAIATAGVYDVSEQIKSLQSKWKHGHDQALPAYLHWSRHLGDPKLDEAYLDSISPLHFADQIQCPVFIAHGKEDSIVSYRQSKLMLKALKKNPITIETYFKYGEGHGFREQENRVEYYQKIEAFLAKHL